MMEFKALADSLPDIVWTHDATGAVEYANEGWKRVTGLPPDVAGTPGSWRLLLAAPGRAELIDALQDSRSRGVAFQQECRLRHVDGDQRSYRWYVVRTVPVRNADGRLVGSIGTATDIHEQKSARDALLERDEIFARVVDASDDYLTVLDLDGRLIPVALNARAKYGLADIAPYVGTNWPELWKGADSKDVNDALAAAREGAIGRFEGLFSMLGAAPKWWDVVVSPIYGLDGRPDRLLTSARDVTEVHAIAAALRDTERHQRALADSLPAIMWSAGADGTIDYVNERWKEYVGESDGEGRRMAWAPYLHPRDRDIALAWWQRCVRSEESQEHEFRLLRGRDRSYRWHLTRAVPVKDESGAVLRWVGTTVDVDESRRAQRRNRLIAELSPALGSLDETLMMDRVVHSIVPEFGDWSTIALRKDDAVCVVSAAHHDAQIEAVLRGSPGALRIDPSAASASARVLRTGQAEFSLLPEPFVSSEGELASVVARLDENRTSSTIVVPLISQGVAIGTLSSTWFRAEHEHTVDDVDLLRELASLVARAIENAGHYERERSWSRSFQRAILPPRLPSVAGLLFDAAYEPGRSEVQVGGDWYDAVRLIDGRVLVSIGDVAGSGLPAAVVMGVVRQIMRGIAQVHANPALMLDAADRALRLEYPDVFVTAWVGIVDLVTKTLNYASAGHPAPLLALSDGTVRELDHTTLPLGLRQGHQGHASTTSLPDGATVLLYTDGITEASRDIVAGNRLLREAAAKLAMAPWSSPAKEIERYVIPEGARDDVALLVMRTDFAEAERYVDRYSFDASDGAAAGRARRDFVASLLSRDFSLSDAGNAELVFGELIGNVARHARTPVDIVVDRSGIQTVLHVLDRGNGFRHISRLPPDLLSESGRGLFIIASMTAEFTVGERPGGGSHARAVLMGRHPVSLLRDDTLPSWNDQTPVNF